MMRKVPQQNFSGNGSTNWIRRKKVSGGQGSNALDLLQVHLMALVSLDEVCESG